MFVLKVQGQESSTIGSITALLFFDALNVVQAGTHKYSAESHGS
jgi:hypothetical protein